MADSINPVRNTTRAKLETDPQRFAFLEDDNGTRADALDAMMGGAL